MPDRSWSRKSVSRRTILRTVGAATSLAAGLSGTTTAIAGADSRTITVPEGELETITVGDGETFENVLIDVTAEGASVQIDAAGSDWTIRNVGVKGPVDGEDDVTVITPSVTDPDGTGLIENVYMGDGEENGGEATGAWIDATGDDAHVGTVVFRHVHVAGMTDNGIYGSSVANHLGDDAGDIVIDRCYGKNNNISQFRIAQEGHVVKDSVAVATDMPSTDTIGTNGRGIRAVDGTGAPALVENCQVKSDWNAFEAKFGSGLRVVDSEYEGDVEGDVTLEETEQDPDLAPPSGVPMSAEDALDS